MADTVVHALPDAEAPAASAAGDALRAEVQEVVRGLAKALRTHLLYEGHGPALQQFLDSLRERMRRLWALAPSFVVTVDEREIHWEGAAVHHGEERESLPFLLYRDGVREVTFRRGFEEEELQVLVELLAQAQRERGEDKDDLLTLFWEHDWLHFHYRYVEALPEGVQLPAESGEAPERLVSSAEAEARAAPLQSAVSMEDFREALYFLDDAELRRLQAELQEEMRRDLWTDVLNALFDRLQDGTAARQEQVVGILGDLLPTLLGAAKVETAAYVLGELVSIATSTPLSPPVLRALRGLFDQLADPGTVAELVRTVEEAGDSVREDALGALLAYFPPEALSPLLLAGETSASPRVRRSVLAAAERLAASHQEVVTKLAADADPHVAGGAARLLGRLRVTAAATQVARLLKRPEAARRAKPFPSFSRLTTPTRRRSSGR